MIVISASALRDYVFCRRKLYWRQKKIPRVDTASLCVGRVIHDMIASCGSGLPYGGESLTTFYEVGSSGILDFARASLLEKLGRDNIKFYRGQTIPKLLDLVEKCYYNYLTIKEWLPPVVDSEVSFDLQYDAYSKVIGRFDQICGENTIVELKTSKREPNADFLANDLQASVYIWAFQELFHFRPTYYYVHLPSGTVYDIKRDDSRELVSLMNQFIGDCNNDRLLREPDGFKCNNCDYASACIPPDNVSFAAFEMNSYVPERLKASKTSFADTRRRS